MVGRGEYLDPGGVGIRAVIKPDGVAHLMSQQGPPLLCYTVSYLTAGNIGKFRF